MVVWYQVCRSVVVLWPYGLRSVVHLMFHGRVVSGLLFTCGFMVYGLRPVHLKICGLRSVVHLMVYGRVVSGLLFTCGFMAYGLVPVVHLNIYSFVVSGLLFT